MLVKVVAIVGTPLNKFLQTENLNLEFALLFAGTSQFTEKQMRENADAEFIDIFKKFKNICSSFNIHILR